MDIFRYAYLISALIFLFIWLILYLYRKDLRHKMLKMSLILAPFGPLSQLLYIRDYWRPELFNGWVIGLEDIIFSFAIGGIASVIYEDFFGKKYVKRHLPRHRMSMLTIVLFVVIFMAIGNLYLGYNSIYVSILVFLIIGLFVILLRHDLLKDAIMSGLLMACLMSLFYFGSHLILGKVFDDIIQRWWITGNISGVLIFGLPIEELAWGFGLGFIAGPIYEFINGLKFKKS